MTPSAPRSNALMMKCGLIRLLHGARTMRTLGAILRRLVPARSAPVYVHQLQTNATTFGSNEPWAARASVGDEFGMGLSSRFRAPPVRRAQRSFALAPDRADAPSRPVQLHASTDRLQH